MTKEVEKDINFFAKLRIKKGYTQAELANMLGISSKAISKWENDNGFPDMVYQKDLANILGVTIEEMHTGRYNHKERLTKRIKTILLYSMTGILIFILPFCLNYAIFYNKYKDSFAVYYFDNVENDRKVEISGQIIKMADYYIVYIGDIDFKNGIVLDNDIYSIDFYSKEEFLYHTNKTTADSFKIIKSDKININNMRVLINLKSNKKEYNYEILLEVYNSEPNNIDMLEKSNKKTSLSIIEQKLIKLGYKKDNKGVFALKTNNKGINNSVTINITNGTIIYNDEGMLYKNMYVYYDFLKYYEVYSYSVINNTNTLVEKYKYYIKESKLLCDYGACSTAKSVKKTLDPYISLLSVD